jgi:hypothetical protein
MSKKEKLNQLGDFWCKCSSSEQSDELERIFKSNGYRDSIAFGFNFISNDWCIFSVSNNAYAKNIQHKPSTPEKSYQEIIDCLKEDNFKFNIGDEVISNNKGYVFCDIGSSTTLGIKSISGYDGKIIDRKHHIGKNWYLVVLDRNWVTEEGLELVKKEESKSEPDGLYQDYCIIEGKKYFTTGVLPIGTEVIIRDSGTRDKESVVCGYIVEDNNIVPFTKLKDQSVGVLYGSYKNNRILAPGYTKGKHWALWAASVYSIKPKEESKSEDLFVKYNIDKKYWTIKPGMWTEYSDKVYKITGFSHYPTNIRNESKLYVKIEGYLDGNKHPTVDRHGNNIPHASGQVYWNILFSEVKLVPDPNIIKETTSAKGIPVSTLSQTLVKDSDFKMPDGWLPVGTKVDNFPNSVICGYYDNGSNVTYIVSRINDGWDNSYVTEIHHIHPSYTGLRYWCVEKYSISPSAQSEFQVWKDSQCTSYEYSSGTYILEDEKPVIQTEPIISKKPTRSKITLVKMEEPVM